MVTKTYRVQNPNKVLIDAAISAGAKVTAANYDLDTAIFELDVNNKAAVESALGKTLEEIK